MTMSGGAIIAAWWRLDEKVSKERVVFWVDMRRHLFFQLQRAMRATVSDCRA